MRGGSGQVRIQALCLFPGFRLGEFLASLSSSNCARSSQSWAMFSIIALNSESSDLDASLTAASAAARCGEALPIGGTKRSSAQVVPPFQRNISRLSWCNKPSKMRARNACGVAESAHEASGPAGRLQNPTRPPSFGRRLVGLCHALPDGPLNPVTRAISGSPSHPDRTSTACGGGYCSTAARKAACPIMMRLADATISSTCKSFQSHRSSGAVSSETPKPLFVGLQCAR